MTTDGPKNSNITMRRTTEAAIALFTSGQSFLLRSEDERRFRIIYPCAAHAVAQVRAALLLLDNALAFPAECNARSAFEHAVTAQWVLLTRGGDEAVNLEVRRRLRAQTADIATFIHLPDELLPGPSLPTGSDQTRVFERMCDRFSPPVSSDPGKARQKTVYAIYRSLSGAVHVSARTWQQYYEWGDDDVTALRPDGERAPSIDLMLALALSAVFAVSAVEALRTEKDYLDALAEIATSAGIPIDLRSDDQYTELQPGPR